MLIKSTAGDFPSSPTTDDPRIYVLSTDGSEASQLAACFLSFLVCNTDRIHIVHVTEYAKEVDSEEILKPYAKLFAANENVTFEVVDSMYSVTVATTIIDYATSKDAHFIVMGISGYGKQKLGSVSSRICREARCNTIIVKDPREFEKVLDDA